MYGYRFDYDGGIDDDEGDFVSDPPHIYITAPDGSDFLEVFLDPTATVAKPDSDDFHWSAPSAVVALVALLNANAAAMRG